MISWIDYIASNNEDGTSRVLAMYGYPKPRDTSEAIGYARQLISENGDDAMDDLMAVHPDTDYILHLNRGRSKGSMSNFDDEPHAPAKLEREIRNQITLENILGELKNTANQAINNKSLLYAVGAGLAVWLIVKNFKS